MSKTLNNFPTVYYLTLKDSHDRQKDLENKLSDRGCKFKKIECYDGRKVDIRDQLSLNGTYISKTNISSENLSVSLSHIKMIQDWLKNTEEEIGFFCEDDIDFSLVDHWNFDFEDVVLNLPYDWKAMMMSLIVEDGISEEDMKIREKKWNDWSCCAYILKRSYAKSLIEKYYDQKTDSYCLDIDDTDHIPFPENIVYPSDYKKCYIFPFFTENRNHSSTLERKQGNERTKIEVMQNQCSEYIQSWWKKNSNKIKLKEIMKMDNKIPVIGVPVVNSTYWITRLVASVDHPVENFVIINNNGRGELDTDLNRLARMNHKYIDNIKVVHMPANIGCAGAWNLIIKCYMNAPYWIIANDDVAFGPGLLKEMVDKVNSNKNIGMVHPNSGDFNIGAWDLFLIRENVVKIFGLFDENTYPAYCEDADYIMRMQHRPIQKVVGLENDYMHGYGNSSEYYDYGSQTKKNEKGIAKKLEEINVMNIEYLTEKWGPNWRGLNPTKTPFENKEMSIGTTTWDLNFVRKKHLGF